MEGRYDKNAVLQAVDATVFETSGFGIFKDRDKMRLFSRLAEKRGLIVLTDSDSAGFLIRNKIKGLACGGNIKHAYIPVSYTHLDVYKRQIIYRSCFTQI